MVRTRSDGAIDSQPFGPFGPEHTVNLAIEQFAQCDESIAERAVTVGTWTRAIKSESDCPLIAADDDTEPDFTNDSKPGGAGAGAPDAGDSFTICASGGDAVAT